MPCLTIVIANVYLADPFLAREGYSSDVCRFVSGYLVTIQWCVNARGHADRSWITPAALLPIALIISVYNLNTCNPFYMFHSVDTWNEQACRITMILWQCITVHARSN